ncbi:phage tail protein [Staphylococcus shinii]|uniref:phage tail protein n=1 Tax=Staphylococcus shinii TaxID=2912228 RepID=UPI000C33C724|nr:hypothetical protein [Staphylococcus shinii]PKI09344.1 hypothetical protein CW747_09670 [Staphylococcus shinii]
METNFVAKIMADISKFMRDATKVQSMSKLLPKEVEVDIVANINDFVRKTSQAKRLANEMEDVKIWLKLGTETFNLKYKEVRAKLKAIRDHTTNIRANNGLLKAKVLQSKYLLSQIPKTITTHIDINTKKLKRGLNDTKRVISNVSKQVVDFNESFNRKMETMASAIHSFRVVFANQIKGVLIASFSALIPIIASLVPVLMAAGNALKAVTGGALAFLGAASIGVAGVAVFAGMAKSALSLLEDGVISATAETHKYNQALESLKDTWTDIIKQNQASIFITMANGLNFTKTALKNLMPFLKGVSKGFENATENMNKWLDTSSTARYFFKMMNTTGVSVFNKLLSASGRFGDGLINVFTQLAPLFQWSADWLDRLGQSFQKWADSASGKNSIQSFIEFTKENLPIIGNIFKNTFIGINNLLKAFSENSTSIFKSLEGLTERFRAWSETVGESEGFKKFVEYMNSVGPQIISLIGNITMMLVNFGIAMAPFGEKVLSLINAFVGWTSAMFEAHPVIAQIIGIGLTLLGVLLAVLPTIVQLGEAFTYLIRPLLGWIAQSQFATKISALLGNSFRVLGGSVFVVISIIAAFVLAIVKLWQTNSEFRENVLSIWESIKVIISAVIDVLTNIFNGLITILGVLAQVFMPIIAIVVQFVAKVLEWIASFIQAHQWILKVIAIIGVIIIAFKIVMGVIALVTTIVGVLSTVFSVLGTVIGFVAGAFSLLTWPVLLVIAVIALVIGIIILLYKKCEWFRNMINSLGEMLLGFGKAIMEGLGKALDWIGDKLGFTSDKVEESTSKMKSSVDTNMGDMTQSASSKMTEMNDSVTSSMTSMNEMFNGQMMGMNDSALTNFSGMSSIGQSEMATLNNTVATNSQSMSDTMANNVTAMNEQVTTGFAQINQNLADQTSNLTNTVSTGLSNMNIVAQNSLSGFSQAVTNEFNIASQNVAVSVAGIRNRVATGFAGIHTSARASLSNLRNTVNANMTSVVNIITISSNRINLISKNTMQQVANTYKVGMSKSKSTVTSTLSAIVDKFESTRSKATSTVRKMMSDCVQEIRSARGRFYSAGGYAMDGFIEGMESRRGSVMSTANSIANSAARAIRSALDIHSPSKVMKDIGKWIPIGLAVGIKSYSGKVIDSIVRLSKDIENSFNPVLKVPQPNFDIDDYSVNQDKGIDHHITNEARQEIAENRKPIVNVLVRNEGDVEFIKTSIEELVSREYLGDNF